MWNLKKMQTANKPDFYIREEEQVQKVSFCPLTYFEDEGLNEILFDGSRAMWLVTAGGRTYHPSPFSDPQALSQWILSLARSANVRLDPIVGAAGGVLQDGALRWHCLLAPMAVDGPIVSIRRHRFKELRLGDFNISNEDSKCLIEAVTKRSHLIIAGPTGSGKTSLLSALLKEIPSDERIFLLESLPEIGQLTPGVVRMVARPANIEQIGGFGLDRLLAESLRLLPDRIVIGEIRANEAAILIDALRSGHSGVMSTTHASSAKEVLDRLTTMANLSASDWARDLSSPVLVVCMERGIPPKVVKIDLL